MARILLNTRASRVTIVDNILLLPAEVKKDERLGNVISPSRTLISERPGKGGDSPYDRVRRCRGTQRLIRSGLLQWSREPCEEPAEAPALEAATSEPEPEPLPPTEPAPVMPPPLPPPLPSEPEPEPAAPETQPAREPAAAAAKPMEGRAPGTRPGGSRPRGGPATAAKTDAGDEPEKVSGLRGG